MARYFGIALVLAALFFTACTSCAMDPETVSMFGGDLSVPKLVDVRVMSKTEVSASFSASILVSSAKVIVQKSNGEIIPVAWRAGSAENSIVFEMEKSPGVGMPSVLSAIVADAKGNTLSFAVPFTGYNDHVARLRISEIRTDYTKPKVEYIEFYVVSSGNLGGIEVFNAVNTAFPSWELPPVEVSAGEYIVWHFRSMEEGLENETGPVNASGGTDSCPSARDLWDTQTKAPFKKTNVILVRERKGGTVMDALVCAEGDKTEWPNDTVRLAAEEAVASGNWKPDSLVCNAASTAGTTATRTLARNESEKDTDTASDWMVCPTGKCSPGRKNAPR